MARLFDASEVGEIVDELRDTAKRNARGQARHVMSTARRGARMAKRSAVKTARSWGRDYPPAIRATKMGATTARFAPEGKAANWSFEEGSRNQPPHRNFARTFDKIEPGFAGEAEDVAHDAFPASWQ